MAAKDILAFAGWEHGLAFAGATGTGGSGGSGTLGGTIVHEKFGRGGYQFKAEVGSGSPNIREGYAMRIGSLAIGGSNVAQLVARVYFAVDALPTGTDRNLILSFLDGSSVTQGAPIRLKPDGTLEAGFRLGSTLTLGALDASAVSGVTCVPGRWYRLDAIVDLSANPWTLNWQIDGVAQTQVTLAQAATTWQGIMASTYYTAVDRPVAHQVSYTDDFAVGSDPAQYPFGPGRSVLLKPNGITDSSTHANAFTDESGGAITGTSWHRVADGVPPLSEGVVPGSANDGLSLRMAGRNDGGGTGGYASGDTLDFAFEDVTLGAGQDVSCVHVWGEGFKSASTPLASANMRMDSGGTLLDQIFEETTTATVSPIVYGNSTSLLRRVTPPGGGWTQANLNALVGKWHPAASSGSDNTGRYWALSALAVEIHLTAPSESDFAVNVSATVTLPYEASGGVSATALLPIEAPSPFPFAPPDTPTLIDLTIVNGDVVLDWQAPLGGGTVTGYRVYRGNASGAEVFYAEVGNVLTYTDTEVVAGSTYYYTVTALHTADESGESNELSSGFLGVNLVWSPADNENETYYGRLPWPHAQAKFSETAVEDLRRRVDLGWHGTVLDREVGAFALVRSSGPLSHLIGERVKVTMQRNRHRFVFVYVNGSTDRVYADLSLTRRAFLGLAALSELTIPVYVEVLS